MLQTGYGEVLNAASRDEFKRQVVRFAQHLGFDTVSAMAVFDHGIGRSDFIAIDNAPPGYGQALANGSASRRDPVMQHCRHHSVPIVWDQSTYTAQGLGELWEEQARFGYCTGIAMALHLPQGRHFVLGVDRSEPLPADSSALTRLVADLQLFAVHAQDAAMRVLAPFETRSPRLTPRELEALRWTMEGKTAWEVGAILSITERTAVMHLNNAMRKLHCTSKHQAVLQALRLGLLR